MRSNNPTGDQAPGGLIARLGARLVATRRALGAGLGGVLTGRRSIDPQSLEDLESTLLAADFGVDTTREVLEGLSARASGPAPADLRSALHDILVGLLAPCAQPLIVPSGPRPFVILAVGINGAGKTTTIAKLAHWLRQQQLTVMLAAADTYRAAAVEQLRAWGERLAIPVIAQPSGADAAAVAHDAMQAAAARGMQVLVIDTAGRLQTQAGLMDELGKIRRVIARFDPEAPHEVLLVLDAGIGQNTLSQFEHFHKAVGVSGLVMTKLDGTARGGVLFALARRTGCPIRFLGVGESLEDLRPFDPAEFVEAILPGADAE